VHGKKLPWEAVITSALTGKRVVGSTGKRVSGELPATAEFGVTELRVGAASVDARLLIVNGLAADAPIEFVTDTEAVPANAASVAETIAVSCVALTNVVALANFVALILFNSSTPFQFTLESLVKFEPFTVSVKSCGLQAGAEAAEVVEAETEVIAGAVPG
jgi:hypothetical protein